MCVCLGVCSMDMSNYFMYNKDKQCTSNLNSALGGMQLNSLLMSWNVYKKSVCASSEAMNGLF